MDDETRSKPRYLVSNAGGFLEMGEYYSNGSTSTSMFRKW